MAVLTPGMDTIARSVAVSAESIRAIVTGGGSGADAALINALPGLEIIASYCVGVDRVDLRCRERGIRVTNTPGVLSPDGRRR
ncbi:hypothetical protein EJB05_22527, partial [Eragrostis curvula]